MAMSRLSVSSATSRAAVPMRPVRPTLLRRTHVIVRAESASKPALAKFADSIGLPTDEGVFGFKPFPEMWVGRWAMFGFVASIWGEATTGRGTLGQLGLDTPSVPLLAVLCLFFGGATLAATVGTVQSVMGKKMPRQQLDRYKSFLGLNNDKDWQDEAARMKGRPSFTTPNIDTAAIEAVRREGMPADRVLSMQGEAAAADAAAAAMKAAEQQPATPAQPAAPQQPRQRVDPNSVLMDDMTYARNIELSNGRAAMLGFLAAVLVEAATGNGILGQLIVYAKLSGLLGADSGF